MKAIHRQDLVVGGYYLGISPLAYVARWDGTVFRYWQRYGLGDFPSYQVGELEYTDVPEKGVGYFLPETYIDDDFIPLTGGWVREHL